MMYTDLMGWYKLANDLTTGTDKYYSLTEYQQLIVFERDLYLDMILERNQRARVGNSVNEDDVVSDFEEMK